MGQGLDSNGTRMGIFLFKWMDKWDMTKVMNSDDFSDHRSHNQQTHVFDDTYIR